MEQDPMLTVFLHACKVAYKYRWYEGGRWNISEESELYGQSGHAQNSLS